MAIVWPCAIPVDVYAEAGRMVEVPESWCPGCAGRLGWWHGYWRHVRQGERGWRIWIRRGRCGRCRATHALLPGFLLVKRLDVVESVGATVTAVAEGPAGVRPAAAAVGVPYTTARGWVRSFGDNAGRLAAGFQALAVELGGEVAGGLERGPAGALAAMEAAWRAAVSLPGWLEVGRWRLCSSVCGGRLLGPNMNSLYFIVGKRRFMPPVPHGGT